VNSGAGRKAAEEAVPQGETGSADGQIRLLHDKKISRTPV